MQTGVENLREVKEPEGIEGDQVTLLNYRLGQKTAVLRIQCPYPQNPVVGSSQDMVAALLEGDVVLGQGSEEGTFGQRR